MSTQTETPATPKRTLPTNPIQKPVTDTEDALKFLLAMRSWSSANKGTCKQANDGIAKHSKRLQEMMGGKETVFIEIDGFVIGIKKKG